MDMRIRKAITDIRLQLGREERRLTRQLVEAVAFSRKSLNEFEKDDRFETMVANLGQATSNLNHQQAIIMEFTMRRKNVELTLRELEKELLYVTPVIEGQKEIEGTKRQYRLPVPVESK